MVSSINSLDTDAQSCIYITDKCHRHIILSQDNRCQVGGLKRRKGGDFQHMQKLGSCTEDLKGIQLTNEETPLTCFFICWKRSKQILVCSFFSSPAPVVMGWFSSELWSRPEPDRSERQLEPVQRELATRKLLRATSVAQVPEISRIWH